MPELNESAKALLAALVDIENHAISVARLGGCQCFTLDADTGRNFPFARFDKAKSVGRPFNQIQWEMVHEQGCPMEGQKGVGRTTYGSPH